MARVVYNQIVRDRIPEIIAKKGDRAEIETVEPDEARTLLFARLVEEVNEASPASPEHLSEELADLLEVVQAPAALEGISPEQLEAIRREKFNERGGFSKRIKLIATTSHHG